MIEFFLQYKWWLVGVLISLVIILLSTSKKEKRSILTLSPEEKDILDQLKKLYNSDSVIDPAEVTESLKIKEVFNNSSVRTVSQKSAHREISKYISVIHNRFNIANSRMLPLDPQAFNINLKKDEKLFHVINGATLLQEKKIGARVQYSGVKFNTKYTRVGSLTYLKDDIINFVKIDQGKIFITDKRILFIGKNNKSKSALISNILTYYIYTDGIILLQSNQNPILFQFNDTSDLILNDGRAEMLLVLERAINNSFSQDLDTDKSLDEMIVNPEMTEEEIKVLQRLKEIENKMDNLKSLQVQTKTYLKNME